MYCTVEIRQQCIAYAVQRGHVEGIIIHDMYVYMHEAWAPATSCTDYYAHTASAVRLEANVNVHDRRAHELG